MTSKHLRSCIGARGIWWADAEIPRRTHDIQAHAAYAAVVLLVWYHHVCTYVH